MQLFKSFFVAATAIALAVSCQKTPVVDASVSFESQNVSFILEDGPEFSIPLTVTGSNISYPLTVTLTDIASTDDNIVYNERDVDWKFTDSRVVINSADEIPVVKVTCINPDLEQYRFKIGIESVDNGGQVGAINETEISISTILSGIDGLYSVKGTYYTSSGSEIPGYEESWVFIREGSTVGFTGLLGMDGTIDSSIWPITGEGFVVSEGENAGKAGILFALGLDNYINIADISGMGMYYIAPAVITTTNTMYSNGVSLVMEQTDDSHVKMTSLTDGGSIVQPFEDSYRLTYALYDVETESFGGYIYGGALKVDDNTVSKYDTGTSGATTTAGTSDTRKILLTNIRTGESVVAEARTVTVEKDSIRK